MLRIDPNIFSPLWFDTFLGEIDDRIVQPEIWFLVRQLPSNQFSSIVDLCCGPGRHLVRLVACGCGYEVVGLDRDESVLRSVPTAPSSRLVRGDMHALPFRDGSVDAMICMWQSFGFGDPAANRAVLADVARSLRHEGRFVLDVYNRQHHEQSQGERHFGRRGVDLTERRWMEGDRLHVSLRYSSARKADQTDEFDWHVYTPDELAAEGAAVGLRLALACTEFDEGRAPSPAHPRMQLVFERVGQHR